MLVLKCKCGCLMTLQEDSISSKPKPIICQNCNQKIDFGTGTNLEDFTRFIKEAGFTFDVVPDDAKINISFDT